MTPKPPGNLAKVIPISPKPFVGFVPELLTPLTEAQALRFVQNPNYWFQRKRDGKRLAVRKHGKALVGLSKLGQPVILDHRVAQAFGRVHANSFLVDGEIESTGWHGWDLLQLNQYSLRDRPYSERYSILQEHFGAVDKYINIVPSATTPEEKIAMVDLLHRLRAEGFAAKHMGAAYLPGRAGQHFKVKFTATASVIVGPKERVKLNDGHRSFGMYLYATTDRPPVYVGSCGCPDKYAMPNTADIVEVKYLYAFPGSNHLVQAKYFGQIRDDVELADCHLGQLKMKADE